MSDKDVMNAMLSLVYTGSNIAEDFKALLRVARAAQAIKEHGHHWSADAQTSILNVPANEIREFRKALKELPDGLLEED